MVKDSALDLDPEASAWGALVRATPTDERVHRFRSQLGLPTNRPIIMAGHQAQLWHPGILAKLFAAQALAAKVGGSAAWLVVDQDANEPFAFSAPAKTGNAPMQRMELDLTPTARPGGPKKPTAMRPAINPEQPAPTGVFDDRLRSMVRAVAGRAGEASAASQVTGAMFDWLGGITERPDVVYASRIAETVLFQECLESARADPGAWSERFNAAVGAVPGSGMGTLKAGDDPELPMWRLDDRGRRLRAKHSDLDSGATIWPGGLLMSGMMRAAGCDLFIHGTGGRAYEPINDLWFQDICDLSLAPFVTASATLVLDFDEREPVMPNEASHARWLWHRAMHDPAMLGDDRARAEKTRLLGRIAALDRKDPRRRALYLEMHALLERARERHRESLDGFAARADLLQRLADEYAVRTYRAWPVPMYDRDRLGSLRDSVCRALRA